MISGGAMPGGNCRSTVCEIAVIWALAVSSRAFGWRNTLMMAWPFSVVRLDVLDVVDRGGEPALVRRW